jgi:hypothetical protein
MAGEHSVQVLPSKQVRATALPDGAKPACGHEVADRRRPFVAGIVSRFGGGEVRGGGLHGPPS